MAAAQQLKDTKSGAQPASDTQKPLYDRLGGEGGIRDIVDDFTTRAMNDPRVNWTRKGVTKGGIVHRSASVEWNPTDPNVEQMKKHIAQFLALSTGGPSAYDGKDMKGAHAGMRISNPEFDAAVGDMKATLDKLHIGDREQKELLAIIESTRQQIVEEALRSMVVRGRAALQLICSAAFPPSPCTQGEGRGEGAFSGAEQNAPSH